MRWGDSADLDQEDDDFDAPLPETQVFGPDKHGIKTIVEYKVKEETGQRVKVTRRVRVSKQKRQVTPAMLARRTWRKFGDAAGASLEEERTRTVVSTEEIVIERPQLEKKAETEKLDQLQAIASTNASLLVCRICGKKGDHWTSKCPYKDLAASKGLTIGESAPDEDAPNMPRAGGYVPPSMRAGASSSGESMYRSRDENSVRVTNLSDDAREQDLQELFRPFGPVTRIYIAFDRETGESRGFAFVNFVNRDDAQRAIDKLDGYGYDNLILRVEWAAPRERKDEQKGGGR